MTILSANEINKSYGADIILESVNFNISKGDRVGIVGPNGAGKTTLLDIITKKTEETSGSIYIKKDIDIGYVRQKNQFDAEGSIIEEIRKTHKKVKLLEERLLKLQLEMGNDPLLADEYTELLERFGEMGGYSIEGRTKGILKSMGFNEDEWDKKIGMLSGGERTRLALACTLIERPDLLILDEPTNNLDFSMLESLEKMLSTYKGTILVVSHDRFFLDKIATRIFDIRNKTLRSYKGNYTDYKEKRKQLEEAQINAYEKELNEIKRQEELIRRYKERGTEKLAKRARSREKRLDSMRSLDKPKTSDAGMKISFTQDYKSGNDVIEVERLKKSFEGKVIFDDIKLKVRSGEHICLVGENGAGKSTFMKILASKEKEDSGYLKIGHNVNIAYFDQEQMLLDDEETVLSEMQNAYHEYGDTEMRNILGRFLFKGDDVFKKIKSLSGGEKSKLSLLKLMLSGANTLLLDEPTNHLDIDSKEAIEEALIDFKGTALIISHDRYLLSRVPDKIYELNKDGLNEFLGKYDYYMEKKSKINEEVAEKIKRDFDNYQRKDFDIDISTSSSEKRKFQKKKEAEERKRARRILELEKLIEELENDIEENEKKMCEEGNVSNPIFLRKCDEENKIFKEKLYEYYEEWEELSSE